MIQIDIHSAPFPNLEVQAKMNFQEGEIAILTGESGSGKSTLLHMISGLIPTKGSIQIQEEYWLETEQEKINLKPRNRDVGYVFQESTLFPNMTVKQNLEYALSGDMNKEILDQYLNEVNLKEFHNRKPDQLSGGQKQRINLIRALIRKPALLLLDEPANAQDQINRKKLQELLIKEKKKGLSILMVSHDQDEIEALADIVFVMKEGKIVEEYSPENRRNKEFEIMGKVINIQDGLIEVETPFGRIQIPNEQNHQMGDQIKLKQKELNLIAKS